MKYGDSDRTLKGVAIASLILSAAIALFAPALRISPDTPRDRRLEYVGVERQIDWLLPGLLGISSLLAAVSYITANALVKKEVVYEEVENTIIAKEVMAYTFNNEIDIEEALEAKGKRDRTKVIEVLSEKPSVPLPAIAPSYQPEIQVEAVKAKKPISEPVEVQVESPWDDEFVEEIPQAIAVKKTPMTPPPPRVPLSGGIVAPDDERLVALWNLLEESAPKIKIVLKAKPLAIVGGMGSYKSNFTKWLCLMRILFLGHHISVADPHAHDNDWPEQFAVYGGGYDYNAIDWRMRRHLELRTDKSCLRTTVFDELTNYEENCDTDLLSKIIGSAVADERKSNQGSIFIAHGLTKKFFGNVDGAITTIKEQWTKVFLYNQKNEVGDDEPQFKGHIEAGVGSEKTSITIFPEWMHPDFLLNTFPELRAFHTPTENVNDLSAAGMEKVQEALSHCKTDISTWQKVAIANKSKLPTHSGCYAVLDGHGTIYYIGESSNILMRWNSPKFGPHKYQAKSDRLKEPSIAFFLADESERKVLEAELVAKYNPEWNGGEFAKARAGIEDRGYPSRSHENGSPITMGGGDNLDRGQVGDDRRYREDVEKTAAPRDREDPGDAIASPRRDRASEGGDRVGDRH